MPLPTGFKDYLNNNGFPYALLSGAFASQGDLEKGVVQELENDELRLDSPAGKVLSKELSGYKDPSILINNLQQYYNMFTSTD